MARGRKRKSSAKARSVIASSSPRKRRRLTPTRKASSSSSKPGPSAAAKRAGARGKAARAARSKSAAKSTASSTKDIPKDKPPIATRRSARSNGRGRGRGRGRSSSAAAPLRRSRRGHVRSAESDADEEEGSSADKGKDKDKSKSQGVAYESETSSEGSSSQSSDGEGGSSESSEFSVIRSSGDEKRRKATRRSARQRKQQQKKKAQEEMESEWSGGEAQEAEAEASSSSSAVTKRPVAKRRRQLSASDREDLRLFTPSFPEERRLEKILAHRFCKESKVHEYLVKWRGYSYIHVEWKSAEDLQRLDAKAPAKVQKYTQALESWPEEEAEVEGDSEVKSAEDGAASFNPEFTNIDHVLAEYVHESTEFGKMPFPNYAFEDTGELNSSRSGQKWKHRYYLIKWCLLGYQDITWEPACAFTPAMLDAKLQRFRQFNQQPTAAEKKKFAPVGTSLVHTLAGDSQTCNFRRMEKSHEYGADKFTLREYQIEGVNWLLWNWCRGQAGSLLGDEMGLGKTIQCLVMLDELRRDTLMPTLEGEFTLSRGPHLIVVPLSCALQWQREIEAWSDLNCVVYHGDEESRRLIRKYHFNYRTGSSTAKGKVCCEEYYRFNVLITTYEMASRDSTLLGKINWHCLVVDEAHRLKNKDSKLVKELKKLRREYCILLTGTPIQNNMQELWCLLNFIVGANSRGNAKGKARSKAKGRGRGKGKAKSKSVKDEVFENSQWFSDQMEQQFMEQFGTVTNHTQVQQLHELLRPFLLRRVKEDVEKSLPPKVETIVEVELTVSRLNSNDIRMSNTCIGGAEETVPRDLREEQGVSFPRGKGFQRTVSDEHHDGAAEVLQPSFPHPRDGAADQRHAGRAHDRSGEQAAGAVFRQVDPSRQASGQTG